MNVDIVASLPGVLHGHMAATAGPPSIDGSTDATIVSVPTPHTRFTLLRAPDGRYLAAGDGSTSSSCETALLCLVANSNLFVAAGHRKDPLGDVLLATVLG